jgi:hypothetical protein
MSYSVGDVFLGCIAEGAGEPYTEPTVLHYASDGVTLLHTMTIPAGAATTNTYEVDGMAVGVDGRLYVLWHQSSLLSTFTKIGIFDADANWVGDLVTVSSTDAGAMILNELPGGDLVVVGVFASDPNPNNVRRYNYSGTLVTDYLDPLGGAGPDGACVKPGDSDTLLMVFDDQIWEMNTLTGSSTGPVTTPYDTMTQEVWGLYSNQLHVYLAIGDQSGSDEIWYISQLSADLLSLVGTPAELVTESHPGGGVDHYGLINNPKDVSINRDGDAAWCVTFTVDTSHSGSPSDSLFRTDLRNTVIPGGTSSAVQSDVNGRTDSVYVFQGFCSTPGTYAGLTMWVEGDSVVGLSDGDEITGPWPESGVVSGNSSDLQALFGGTPPTWRANVLNTHSVVKYVDRWDGIVGDSATDFDWQITNTRTIYGGFGTTALFNNTQGFTAFVLARLNLMSADYDPTDPLRLSREFWAWTGIVGLAGNQQNGVRFVTHSGGVRVIANLTDIDASPSKELMWSGISLGQWLLVEVVSDGTNFSGEVNGCAAQSVTCGFLDPTSFAASQSLFVGMVSNPDPPADGDVAALAVYDRPLTLTERATVRCGLMTKYGISIDCGTIVPGPGGGGGDVRLRTTQFMRIGMGAGI